MAEVNNRIALLATGDEIINGDILNTNCQYLSHGLYANNLQPGTELVVEDNQDEIESAIHYLLANHVAVITIGGLGPTSDDRTRFAIARAIKQELVFDEDCWQRIVERLTRLNYSVPDSNKQQCLFPKGATIIPNENGTAAACYIQHDNKHLYMLPGPPKEIQPIFDNVVLPQLITYGLQQTVFRQAWLLLGIGEGNLAQQLDPIVKDSECNIGYRVALPYIELKLSASDKTIFSQMYEKFLRIISSFIISEKNLTASQQLRHYLEINNQHLLINDNATQGLLQAQLSSPKTVAKAHFYRDNHDQDIETEIHIDGLQEYWNQASQKYTNLSIAFKTHTHSNEINRKILLRGRNSLILAVELICWEVLQFLIGRQENSC